MTMLSTMIYTVVFIVVFIIAGIIFIKVRKAALKPKSPEKPKEEGDDKKDPNQAQASTNLIKVVIFRPISDGLVAQVGDPIMCVEKPDVNNNLMVTNEDKNFKEDFNFNKNRIFESLEFSLKTQNKTRKEKAVVFDEAIKDQEDLLKRLDTQVELNEKYNYQDESLKLRQLKVLREALQKETTGNYLRLGKGGVRQYEFVSIDGVLYPYFFGSKWYRVYPDLLVKKKIFNQENTIFRNEVGNLQKNILNWVIVAALVIGLIMMGLGGWMMKHAYGQNTEVTMTANKGVLSCTDTLAAINANYGTIISDYQQLKQKEMTESIKSPEIPNSNIGGIVIDPSKIQR